MRKYRWKPILLAILLLFLSGCGKEQEEPAVDKPEETAQQEIQQEDPVLTSIPTGEQRMAYWQSHSEQQRAIYQQQLYTLLDQCTAGQVCDGLQQELKTWSAGVKDVTFTQVQIVFAQDPLLMWSGGDKRQYRNITATFRLFYDPSTLQGEEKGVMEPLLEQAQQIIRQSPYGLKLLSAELIFVDQDTEYPNYSISQVSVGVPGEKDPSALIPPEEQILQTLAYEEISAFCKAEFTGSQFEGLPYANMTLSRFGVAENSQVLECQARIEQSNGQQPQDFAQKLEQLAQQLAGKWEKETEALETLGITEGIITFDFRYSPDGPIVFELPLTEAEKK